MKKVTLVTFIIFIMAVIQPSDEMGVMITEAKTFSNAETFSVSDALDTYIQISLPSVQVYYYTKKYCKEFNVPETVAFGVVKQETSYKGPDNHDYNPSQISSANAYGAYQLLLSTAKDMYVLLNLGNRNELTAERLLTDVKLNSKLGIRYLRYLNDNVSKNWTVVCGFYNTGYPQVNTYAIVATKYM
jgi:hypothetical protein